MELNSFVVTYGKDYKLPSLSFNSLLAQMLQKNTNCHKRRTGMVGFAKLSDVSLPSCSLALLVHEVNGEMHYT